MADAYSLNMTTGALSKNGVNIPNLIDVQVDLRYDFSPGVAEGAAPQMGFAIKARVHDTAADARVTAQGPSNLFANGPNPRAQYIGYASRYVMRSKPGDTIAFTNVPGTITAAYLETVSADGFAP